LFINFKGQDGSTGSRGKDGKPGKMIVRKHCDTGKTDMLKGGTGGNGGSGTRGENGQNVKATIYSQNGVIILDANNKILTISGSFVIDASGGKGGDGGPGGNGGSAGKCTHSTGGGLVGSSGSTGKRGAGGNGGNGGNITLRTTESHLLGLATLKSNGGRGGNGLPSGTSGKDGTCTFVLNADKTEKDTNFGLSIDSVGIEYDSSYINGNVTRGSSFKLHTIVQKNNNSIRVEEGFKTSVNSDENIEILSDNCFYNEDQIVHAHSSIEMHGNIDFKVKENSEIGFYKLYFNTLSTKYNISISLGRGEVEYTIPVNHRFDKENNFTELLSEYDQNLIKDLVQKWNSFKPDLQLMLFTAYLMYPLIENQDISDEKIFKKYKNVLNSLKGKLFDPSQFSKIWDYIQSDEDIDDNIEIYKIAAYDLYNSLPDSSSSKLIDAMFLLAGIDDYIEEDEKKYILEIVKNLNVNEEWVQKEMSVLYEEGDSKIEASAKNDYTTYLIPGVTGIIAGIFSFIFASGWLSYTLSVFTHPFIVASTMVISFLISTYLVRRFLFYKACHNCESTLLQARSSDSRDTLSDINNYQCKDCRAIGNEEDGDDLQLLSSDTKFEDGKNYFYLDIKKTKTILIVVNILGLLLSPIATVFGYLFSFYPTPVDKSKTYKDVINDSKFILGGVLILGIIASMFWFI